MPPKNTSPSMRRRENITGFSRRGTLELARKAAKSTLAARLRAASVRTRAAPVACSRKRGIASAGAPLWYVPAVPRAPRSPMTSLLAYLDPGSGSMLLQAIVGGAAAVGVVGKLYWRRLLAALRIRKRPDEQT